MAKKFNVRAPESVKLHEMDEKEIAEMVKKEATRMLDSFPKEYRPIGVNVVTVESIVPATKNGAGVMALWERACCSSRDKIAEFTDPVIREIEPGETVMSEKLLGTHYESQMRVIRLENSAMHGKQSH
jgi:hypothetical protein